MLHAVSLFETICLRLDLHCRIIRDWGYPEQLIRIGYFRIGPIALDGSVCITVLSPIGRDRGKKSSILRAARPFLNCPANNNRS